MNAKYWQTKNWSGDLTAFFTGTLITLSLAPYSMWGLGVIACGLFAQILTGLSPRRGFFRAFCFGLGMYFSGASWIHVSVSSFGLVSSTFAVVLTTAFVVGLAGVFAVPFYLYCKYIQNHRLGFVLGFPAIWVIGEWLRTWLFTGFPWLFLGYSNTSTWLAGWAPIIGVLGLSFLSTLTSVTLFDAYNRLTRSFLDVSIAHRSRFRLIACGTLGAISGIWLVGLALQGIHWTKPTGENKNIALVQPNIAQEMKWDPRFSGDISQTLLTQSETHWDFADIIVWPEAAIPYLYSNATALLDYAQTKALESNTALIAGVLVDDDEQQKFFNSIVGLGKASGRYSKQRLVPFGEYVPLEAHIGDALRFFSIPTSLIHAGDAQQPPLKIGTTSIATSICYEVVYPSLVADYAAQSQFILTISNDAWFGRSIGPIQHFQMTRMRALENQKYVVRVANTGITGVINPNGSISSKSNQFEKTVLTDTIELRAGTTPFGHWKSRPIVLLALSLLAFIAFRVRKKTVLHQANKQENNDGSV